MNLVLAIEPDSSQADPLSSVVRTKLGAELVLVTSAHAAIAATNQRVPDLVLFGREVPQDQRVRIATHLRVLASSSVVRMLDIPPLASGASAPRSGLQNSLREKNAGRGLGDVESFENQLGILLAAAEEERAGRPAEGADDAPVDETRSEGAPEADSEIHLADISLIEAEVEFRLKNELERALAEAEIARVKAEADAARATAIEEAHLAAEAEAMRARAAEIALAKAEAAAARAAAIEDARVAAEAEAMRALEAEIARIKADTDAQVQAAVARARTESEAELAAQVSRTQSETVARLEAQLASLRTEAEQARHAHLQAVREADRIRLEAAEFAHVAAAAVVATETERIRADSNQSPEAAVGDDASIMSRIPRVPWNLVRWELLVPAALLAITIVAAVIWLPRISSSTVKTSSALTHTAGKAVSEAANAAVSVAPSVKEALVTAERAARRQGAAATASRRVDQAPSAPLSGFLVAFSRIPMDLYSDGRRIGTTEDGQLLLKSGSHRIQFVSERFNYRSTVTLTIRPGEVTAHTLALPSGRLRVTTTPGAEVWIEGERVGVAPLDPVAIPIGTREVIVKDASFGERRASVEVKNGQTAELTVIPGAAAPAAAPRLAPLSQYQP